MSKRWLRFGVVVLALAGASACGRPSEEQCKKAVDNIRMLTETEGEGLGPDPYAAVRSCRANASKDAVACMIAAKTREDLMKCEGSLASEVAGGK